MVSKKVPGADEGVDAAGAGEGAGACPHTARAAILPPPRMISMMAALHRIGWQESPEYALEHLSEQATLLSMAIFAQKHIRNQHALVVQHHQRLAR
jgi:hypothetical protein